ncbi:MAG TPA: TonB-dependent receptor, partial [Sphingobacterium sp.]|nr:TonB-dependent receptor [Sphingobacterium sp.]
NPGANYLVIGNEMLKQTLHQMQDRGEISEIKQYTIDQLDRNLKAEQSTSFNVGAVWKASSAITAELSGFYHSIHNQIHSIPVATGTEIGYIYSYQNLPKVVNKGVEANLTWSVLENLNLQVGYQYMTSRNLGVIDSIRAGNWPYNQNIHNPATGESFAPPSPSDYWGIESRSHHMLNARVFYTYQPWDTNLSLRLNYRGKYPFMDYNGNEFIDRFDHFVPAHTLLNALVEKKLYAQRMTLRLTVDNILDFKHQFMPGQPDRIFLIGMSYRWQKRYLRSD